MHLPHEVDVKKKLAPTVGLEPTTYWLTANCTAIVLHGNKNGAIDRIRTCNNILGKDALCQIELQPHMEARLRIELRTIQYE